MLTAAELPSFDPFFTIECSRHGPGERALREIIAIEPAFWVSPEQMAKAAETGSICVARWVTADPPKAYVKAAADFDVLVDVIRGMTTDATQSMPRY